MSSSPKGSTHADALATPLARTAIAHFRALTDGPRANQRGKLQSLYLRPSFIPVERWQGISHDEANELVTWGYAKIEPRYQRVDLTLAGIVLRDEEA